MRLRRFTLDRFGHFAGQSFDFGSRPDGPDFHVIYGPNEAGKTTVIEAFMRLFYGWKARGEPYVFDHGRDHLRLSAEVESPAVGRLQLIRHGRSLTDGAGAMVAPDLLATLVGGLTDDAYRARLCLTRDGLVKGGEDIAKNKNDLGRILFAAASGMPGLAETLDALRDAAGALHKPRGRTEIAALKARRKALAARIKRDDIQPGDIARLDAEEARTADAEARAREVRGEAAQALHTARALRQAFTPYASARRAREEAAAIPDRPLPPGLDDSAMVAAVARAAALREQGAELGRQRATLDRRAEAVCEDPALAALHEEVTALADLRTACAAARADLPRRRQREGDLLREMAQLIPIAAQEPLAYAVPPSTVSALQAAAGALATTAALHETKRASLGEASRALDEHMAELPTLSAGVAAWPDIRAILDNHQATHLAHRYEEVREDAEGARLAAATARATVGETRRLTLTPQDLADHTANLDSATADLRTAREAVAGLEAEEAAHVTRTRPADLPDAAASQALRARRDALWAEHRRQLDAASADAFAAAMGADDTAQARHIADANRIAAWSEHQLRLEEVRAKRAAAQRTLETATKTRDAVASRSAELAEQLGLKPPATPTRLQDQLRAVQNAERLDAEAHALQQHLAEYHDKCAACLAALSPIWPGQVPATLRSALDQAADWRAQAATHAALAEQTAHQATKLKRSLARAEEDEAKAARRAEDAETAWAAAVDAAFGNRPRPPLDAAGLEHLAAYAERGTELRELRDRITKMEGDATLLTAQIAPLADRHGIPDGPIVERYDALRRAVDDAHHQAQEAERLRHERAQHAQRVDEYEADSLAHRLQIDAWGEAMGLERPDLETLRSAVDKQAARDRALCAARDATELACSILGVTASDLDGQMGAWSNPGALDTEVEAALSQLAEAEAVLSEATQAAADARAARAALTDDPKVAVAQSELRTIDLTLTELAQDWARLRIGAILADHAIRRHREAHRPAMLAGAETAFAALTHGRYPRLDVENDKLLAFDKSVKPYDIDMMSTGQQSQLFLALRAGAYAMMADRAPPPPMLCDDVFESFDEDRTRAACILMDQIGQRGQAIYLTHHRHVVDIAREVTDGAVRVHELPDSAP